MITFLVEDDPSPEKEIWITASTMFRFCHLFHVVLSFKCYWLVRFLLSGFQVLFPRFSGSVSQVFRFCFSGASHVAGSSLPTAPPCSSAFPPPPPLTPRSFRLIGHNLFGDDGYDWSWRWLCWCVLTAASIDTQDFVFHRLWLVCKGIL